LIKAVISNLQQPLSKLLKLKETNPILKALLKFCTTKNLFKFLFVFRIEAFQTLQ